jgi:tetratricopeptide (TPR) repeat protein
MHLAADLFARVVQLDPGNATALVNLKLARAAARTSKPSAKYVETAAAEARAALDAGRNAAALVQLDKLLAHGPSAKLYLLRARARLGLRQGQRAVQDAGRSLALDPGLEGAFRTMGDAHRQLGNKAKALYYYRLFLARSAAPADDPQRTEIERAVNELQ